MFSKSFRWLAILSAVVCASIAVPSSAQLTVGAQVPADTACTLPRVRKSWDSYTSSEKTLYKNAVQLAMDKGLHIKFIEMHTEYFSELEAHRQCMFIYWHRRFLLGYENMLRSLAPEYQCVTIPVWDHLYATAKRQMGRCTSLLSCSQIYKDFGGTSRTTRTTGKNVALVIYNQTIAVPTGGTCVTNGVPSHFCGKANVPPYQPCQYCITRGAPTNDYPGDAYLSSVSGQIFPKSMKWIDFANGIERGVHNSVHGYLDGVMSYFQSPADPLFYTHHAFVDATQTIYLKCAFNTVTNQKLTSDQKTSDKVWQSCERRPVPSGKFFQPSDTITMKVTDSNGNWVDVATAGNTLFEYFKDLPKTFGAYIDASDLGKYSYTYSFKPDSNMYQLWTKCQNAPTAVSLKPSLLGEEDESHWDTFTTVWKAKNSFTETVHKWTVAVYTSATLAGYTEEAAREMLEIITCTHKNECLSPTQDYPPVFRHNFGVKGHSRCYTLLDMVQRGDKVIGVPHWREITEKFLPCPLKDRLDDYDNDFDDDKSDS